MSKLKYDPKKVAPRLGGKIDIRVLNVGEGDLNITFDKTNKQERENAKKVITDLLRQGFAIMVEAGKDDKGPLYRRVKDFDPNTGEYVVMGSPDGKFDKDVPEERPSSAMKMPESPIRGRGRTKKQPDERIPASRPVVAVGRTAGGYDPIILRTIRRGGRPGGLAVTP